jgi:hypothetical protein
MTDVLAGNVYRSVKLTGFPVSQMLHDPAGTGNRTGTLVGLASDGTGALLLCRVFTRRLIVNQLRLRVWISHCKYSYCGQEQPNDNLHRQRTVTKKFGLQKMILRNRIRIAIGV